MWMKIESPEFIEMIRKFFVKAKVSLTQTRMIKSDRDIRFLEYWSNAWIFCHHLDFSLSSKPITFEELKKVLKLEVEDFTIPLTSMKVGQIALYKGQEGESENHLIDAVVMCIFNSHYKVQQYAIIKKGPKQAKRAKKSLKMIDAVEAIRVQLIESCLIDSVDISGYQGE